MATIIIDPYVDTDKEIEFVTVAYYPELDLSISSQCFFYFPQFEKDFEALWRNEIITTENKKL